MLTHVGLHRGRLRVGHVPAQGREAPCHRLEGQQEHQQQDEDTTQQGGSSQNEREDCSRALGRACKQDQSSRRPPTNLLPMTDQPNNPLHGITLESMLTELVERYGWDSLGNQVNIRCFQFEPSIKSSLKFLRRTPWARAEVEALYLRQLR